MGATYVSNSYGTGYTSTPGSGEDPSDPQTSDLYYNHPGVAVVASSGDDDTGVSFPASSPVVTSVGGTSLVRAGGTTRGWSESVWSNEYGGPGSGCSLYEEKPAFQTDTGCDKRTVADVSAVSDPATGVAVYNTYGDDGWAQYGGTSAASPIIASVYALGGPVPAGTAPVSFPYAKTSALNDVTTGDNGSCDPDYLCTAGAGYDGPTGLGTPDGVAAFSTGPHGIVAGTVTDTATGDPVGGATVSAGDASATTDADGTYRLTVEPGSYTLTVTAFGYATKSVTGVTVTDGETVTRNVALTAVPSVNLSGTVTDGSGHAWPLYARISIDGKPGAPVYTDPITGHYSIDLPRRATYTLHVDANYPGYLSTTSTVKVGSADLTKAVKVKADVYAGTAPGYRKTIYRADDHVRRHRRPTGRLDRHGRHRRRRLGVRRPGRPREPHRRRRRVRHRGQRRVGLGRQAGLRPHRAGRRLHRQGGSGPRLRHRLQELRRPERRRRLLARRRRHLDDGLAHHRAGQRAPGGRAARLRRQVRSADPVPLHR